jgi:branched-chain amino acid transport system permease protein
MGMDPRVGLHQVEHLDDQAQEMPALGVVAVLGGLGNMYGALAGGLVLGLAEAWGGQYLPGTLVNAVAFGVLVIVLVVRPAGLVGRAYSATRLEV